MSKVIVQFHIQFNYPFGPISHSVKKLFGETEPASITQIVDSIPSGYGRLTKICNEIKKRLF